MGIPLVSVEIDDEEGKMANGGTDSARQESL